MPTHPILHMGPSLWQLSASDLYKDRTAEINWLKVLEAGVGTKHQRAYLIRSMKGFLLARLDHPTRKWRSRLAHSTFILWFSTLCSLARWMVAREIWRFSQLTIDDLLLFLSTRRARHGTGKPAATTLSTYITLLEDMWDLRFDYVAPLRIDVRVFSVEIGRACNGRDAQPWKPVDESAALALVFDAIEWLENYGDFFVDVAAEIYREQGRTVGLSSYKKMKRIKETYRVICQRAPFPEIAKKIGVERLDADAVARAFSVTQGAAFNILLFLVGMRVMESVRLDVGCVQSHQDENGLSITSIRGVAAKKDGAPREWVAGEPVPRTIEWLEDLYEPVRKPGNTRALFLARTPAAPFPLPGRRVARMGSMTPVSLINAFANAKFRNDRPQVKNLHPHAARKTFARFVVKRDKRALEALSFHFGHAFRAFTDGAYGGSDIELERLLDLEERQELGRALTVLLEAPRIAGKGAEAIEKFVQTNVRFRGKLTLSSVVDSLIKQGVSVAPCDWGYCIYSEAHSACKGDRRGPNEVSRSPEVCAGCKNFAVTPEHLSWWNDRAAREEAFLDDESIPQQARLVATQRLKQSKAILAQLNADRFAKASGHG